MPISDQKNQLNFPWGHSKLYEACYIISQESGLRKGTSLKISM